MSIITWMEEFHSSAFDKAKALPMALTTVRFILCKKS